MKEFDQWARLQSRYKPLKVQPHRSGHSLTAEEEERLKTVAFSKKKWRLAAHCMVVMMNTTMGFGELRQLRRRDVDMARPCVTVREGAKNQYRQRTIPLNAAARESMEYILKRWAEIGGSSPEHYILPHRPRGEQAPHWSKKIPWILDEPTTSMNSAFRSIRNAAGLPHVRIYDCRVQAITKLLSSPQVSPQASREIAGHISQEMQNRYSIQTFSTKKAALDTLDAPPPAPVTSEATHAAREGASLRFPEGGPVHGEGAVRRIIQHFLEKGNADLRAGVTRPEHFRIRSNGQRFPNPSAFQCLKAHGLNETLLYPADFRKD